MSDLSRRSAGPPSRRSRERNAYRAAMVGGTAAAIGVVTLVLAAIGIMGFAIPVLAIIVAIVCALWFKRTVS